MGYRPTARFWRAGSPAHRARSPVCRGLCAWYAGVPRTPARIPQSAVLQATWPPVRLRAWHGARLLPVLVPVFLLRGGPADLLLLLRGGGLPQGGRGLLRGWYGAGWHTSFAARVWVE